MPLALHQRRIEIEPFLQTRLDILQFMLGGQLDLSPALQELLNEQTVGVFVLAASGESVFTNQYALDLLRVPRSDGTAQWSEVLEYLDLDGSLIALEHLPSVRALAGMACGPETIQIRSVRTGLSVSIHAIAEPVRDANGEVLGTVAVSIADRDIGRDFSWGSRYAIDALVEQAPYPLAIVDAEMRYLAHSQAWLAQPEVLESRILGRSHEEVFQEPDPSWASIRDRALAGETHSEQGRRIPAPNGRSRFVDLQVVPWRTPLGGLGGLVLHRRDVTARVEAVAALERTNQRLRATNEALEQFAYAASHDLQEPLRVVGQYAQLLARRYDDALDERGQRYLGYLVDGTARMSEMVAGLLAYAVATPTEQAGPVALDALVTDVLQSLNDQLAAPDVTVVHPPSGFTLSGDAALYASVFRNLLSNAIKYRSSERPLRIEVTAHQEAGEAVIAVSDNGRGFTPEQQERMFRLFQRLDNVEQTEGTGLGLALVRRQLAVMGGSISAMGTPGVGAVFTIRAPLA
jgi:PAS domain S-box-containing protein